MTAPSASPLIHDDQAAEDLDQLAAELRRQAVDAEAALAALGVRRRALALDVRLGRASADDLRAIDAEVEQHRAALSEVAELLPALEQRRQAERDDRRARARAELDALLAELTSRRGALLAEIIDDPKAKDVRDRVERYGIVARQVVALAGDLLGLTGDRRYQPIAHSWQPGAGLPDRLAEMSVFTSVAGTAARIPRPPIPRPWAEALAVARGEAA